MPISRRYEGAPAPVSRKPAVKKVVARKPPAGGRRRYEGAALPKAPVKRPAVPRPTRRYEGATPIARKPSPIAASDVRHAPTVRPGGLPILKARGRAAAAGAQLARQGAAANDQRKSYVPPRSVWQTNNEFNPSALLDASQVQDLRGVNTRVTGRVRARHVYNRDFAGRVEGSLLNRPTGRKPARRKSWAI